MSRGVYRVTFMLVVKYRGGSIHRNEYDTEEELLSDLHYRIADHQQYGSVKHWKIIPSKH